MGSTQIDERRLVEDIIKNRIRESNSDLKEVKNAITETFTKRKNRMNLGLTIRDDIDKCKRDVENIVFILKNDNYTLKSCAAVANDIITLLIPVIRIDYDFCLWAWEYLQKEEIRVSLSIIDHKHIERTYITYCLNLWLREAVSFTARITQNKNYDIIKDLFNVLDSFTNFRQLPEPLRSLRCNELLMNNRNLIDSENEKTFINKFKTDFREQLIADDSFENELDFQRVFIEVLIAHKNTREIIDRLKLVDFCSGSLSFHRFLDNIIALEVVVSHPELATLKDLAHCLKNAERFLLVDKFKEDLSEYIKPVKFPIKQVNGRSVIHVTGKIIVLSQILQQLQAELASNPEVAEVHIAGANILHIDADLKNEIWHGMNIVVFVKKIKVHREVTWNVSGKDSDLIYTGNAGTGQDGHGKPGEDGGAGESGGNVDIAAEEVENPEYFTIISYGGKGSGGQDGGDGSDGKDGKGITKQEFDDKFKLLVPFLSTPSTRGALVRNTVDHISKLTARADNKCSGNNVFITATTYQGNEITFSFCAAKWNCRFQAFLIYKGSLGQPGGHGGKYGSGGNGGYGGNISSNNPHIVIRTKPGETGKNGKGGLYGYHGKNGWDMAYMDYQHWSKAVYFGSQQNSKLRLDYYKASSSDRIWCPYYEQYAEITDSLIEHKKNRQYEKRRNTEQSNETLQRQAQATKKKAISQSSISAEYGHYFQSTESSYADNIQATLANIRKRALEEITENSEQQENVTREVEVKRHVHSIHQDKKRRRKNKASEIPGPVSETSHKPDVKSLINEWNKNPLLNTWLEELVSVELNHSDLEELFSNLTMQKNNFLQWLGGENNTENEQLQQVEEILNKKYGFAVLQKIAKLLPNGQNNDGATPKDASRYLIVAKKNDDTTYNDYLGTLNEFLYVDDTETRAKISDHITAELQQTNSEALQRFVKAFVLEVGKTEEIGTVVEQYYDEYDTFMKEREHRLNSFHSTHEANAPAFAQWIQSSSQDIIKVMKEIEDYNFLTDFYNRYDNILEETYDWSKCYDDQELVEKYHRHIKENGPLSESYRELLAYVFDINIRLYKENEDNKFCLIDNHKPLSDKVIHILLRDNKLIELKIDENLVKLDAEREKMGPTYLQILSKTKLLKCKEEFDDYFAGNTFSSDVNLFEYDYLYQQSNENTNEQGEDFSDPESSSRRLDNPENEALIQSLKAFILEVGETENLYPMAKAYYNEYEKYLQTQKHGLNKYFAPLCRELEQHKRVFALWVTSNNNKSVKIDLKNEMGKHKHLNTLYRQFDNQIKQSYNWHKCCKDQVLLKERDNFIRKKRQFPSGLNNQDNRSRETDKNDDYLQSEIIASNLLENQYRFSREEEQKYINEIMKYFSSQVEQLRMKKRLAKISTQYTGQQSIIHIILSRFTNDERHVSCQELCYLVNSILSSVNENKEELNIYCWIVAAHSQENWTDELMLLQFQNYFKQSLAEKKYKWRQYLSKIVNKEILLSLALKLGQHKPNSPISIQCIEDTLHLLSSIPNIDSGPEDLELSDWPCALKGEYWTAKLSELLDWRRSNRLTEASYYLLSVENTFGTNITERFVQILKEKTLTPDILTNTLHKFYTEKWTLGEEELTSLSNHNYREWTEKMGRHFIDSQNERDITELVRLIKGNSNTTKGISDKLSAIENAILSINKRSDGKKNSSYDKKQCSEKHVKLLDEIAKVIETKRKFKLRDTQKLAVLALLSNDRSILAQVSTGEGKSLIVVAASIIKACCKEKVDIITSSSVLAKRDAEINKEIYDAFKINVSHNCDEKIDKRRQAYSGSQVVYGDLSNFQRDYLLDRFYGKNILGDRNFENIIVDEVDSMLLDKGNNMLYLSHDLAGLDKLESVYIFIWQRVNRPAKSEDEVAAAFDRKAIKEAVLYDLYGLVTKEDIKKLGGELEERQVKLIWSRLIEAKILDDQGKMLKENIGDDELERILPVTLKNYENRLRFLLNQCIQRDKYISVPNYLKPFIEQHLETWIYSAIMAVVMQERHDYIVDVDRTGTSPDLNPNITILDRDTGTDQGNSQWGDALHQFLQLKHGCKLSLQSLKAVFISNVSYLKLYRNLYGLTGTLGSQEERKLLTGIYGVDFVTIPTARSKQFHEEIPIFCNFKEEWIEKIFNEAIEFTEKRKRSVLIICETIDDAETLNTHFVRKNTKDVHTYTRDYEEFSIAKGNRELEQGQIIIATNLSGRGTDIKIIKELRKAGGLHVCLSYLPSNSRIEQQAFGRAARSGDKGSGRLIIMGSEYQKYSNSKVLDLKRERDADESYRIASIKAHYETQISSEEHCFKEFQKQYERLSTDLTANRVDPEVMTIFMQSCLDRWAFWLDKNSADLKNVGDEQSKKKFANSLNKFISELENLKSVDNALKEKYKWYECFTNVSSVSELYFTRLLSNDEGKNWLTWVINEQPIQMIKLGLYFVKNQKYNYAIELFNRTIAQEPSFSEAAHYYKAVALLKKIHCDNKHLDKQAVKEFKTELREVARLINERINFSYYATGVIRNFKQHDNRNIIQIDGYAEQHKNLSNLYYMFLHSIDNILGRTVTSEVFVNHDIDEDLAEVLYEDLLRYDILKGPKMKNVISEEALKKISVGYGISMQELRTCLSPFKGKVIDEKKLQEALEKGVKLPSREEFWNLLLHGSILCQEVEYITVNVEKLKTVDPAMLNLLRTKIETKELESKILETKELNGIILHTEQTLPQHDSSIQKEESITFIEGTFKTVMAINTEKYELLKHKGVFSFNKKAVIHRPKIASFTFPCYDSITLQDFSKQNIVETDAEKILAELVERQILEMANSENGTYRLLIPSNEIALIQLPSYPVYQGAVKALLSTCFVYRIALGKIEMQLKERSFPTYPSLPSKPHNKLICGLIDRKFIRPAKVNKECEDLEDKLKRIYMPSSTSDNVTTLGFPNLIPRILRTQDLLIAAGIRTPSFYKSTVNENELNLDNRSKLRNQGTIKYIAAILELLKGTLKTINIPRANLKPLAECFAGEFNNIEEVHILGLNGMDHLLRLDQEKWTVEMFCNTAIVIAMGVTQIAIGVVIELFSDGLMTHVGSAFISEGVSDLFFAATALGSGYFSWRDYRQHKITSLMMTSITSGLGACLSRGTQVSLFGRELFGTAFEIGELAEQTGIQLVRTGGTRAIAKEVFKRIAYKTTSGILVASANSGVDMYIKNWLRGLCENITSSIISNISNTVAGHKISAILESIFQIVGEEKAMKLINDFTKSALTKTKIIERLSGMAVRIARRASDGIVNAAEMMIGNGQNAYTSLAPCISEVLDQVPQAEELVNLSIIRQMTGNFLTGIEDMLKFELTKQESKYNPSQDGRYQRQHVIQDCENFKKKTVEMWQSLLKEKTGKIVETLISRPIAERGAEFLANYCREQITRKYQVYQANGCKEEFEDLKRQYQQNRQNTFEQESGDLTELEINDTKKYHQELIKLAARTRDPDLYADILEEAIPLDFIAISAYIRVLGAKLASGGLTVRVTAENGAQQAFSSNDEGLVEGEVIELGLEGNHLKLRGSSGSANGQYSGSINTFLYEAISERVDVDIPPAQVRTQAANHVRQDPDLRREIQQGSHALPLSNYGAFGIEEGN